MHSATPSAGRSGSALSPAPASQPAGAPLSPRQLRRRARLARWNRPHREPNVPSLFAKVNGEWPTQAILNERMAGNTYHEVAGHAMAPNFRPGDAIAVSEIATPRWAALMPHVYLVALPGQPARLARLTAAALAGRGRLRFTFDNVPGEGLWVQRSVPGLRLYRLEYLIYTR